MQCPLPEAIAVATELKLPIRLAQQAPNQGARHPFEAGHGLIVWVSILWPRLQAPKASMSRVGRGQESGPA